MWPWKSVGLLNALIPCKKRLDNLFSCLNQNREFVCIYIAKLASSICTKVFTRAERYYYKKLRIKGINMICKERKLK